MVVEEMNLLDYNNRDDLPNDKLPQITHLTPRQWELYRLIKYNSVVEHRKTTQREIYEKVSGYEWRDDPKAHDHCVAIWKDIKDNNESLEHDGIIISKNFEYWLGSETETKEFLKSLWKQLAPRLTRYWNYYKKIDQNRQGKLLDKNNNPIDDNSVAKRFYECFNEYDITMGAD